MMTLTRAMEVLRTTTQPWEMPPVTRVLWRHAPGVMRPLERWYGAVNPAFSVRRKQFWETVHWRRMQRELKAWFVDGTLPCWWGVPQPSPAQRVTSAPHWLANAILTLHRMRPTYWEELQLAGDHFAGQRILEVGCGPLIPSLQFTATEHHALDPLLNAYRGIGFPVDEFGATLVNSGAETIPYPDGHFDSVLSVNALDHVDDFERTAAEMTRVTKPGGGLYIEVEYHAPTDCEPLVLSDARVRAAFAAFALTPVIRRSGREMFGAIVARFGLQPSDDTLRQFTDAQFVTWHGRKVHRNSNAPMS